MISNIVGKWLSKKALIWTGVAILGAASIPAIGATVHHKLTHKTGITHRTSSLMSASHKSTKMTSHKSTASSASNRPGFPLALEGGSAVKTSTHSAKLTSSKSHKSSTKLTASKKKATPLKATSSGSLGGQDFATHGAQVVPPSTSVGPELR